jgi:hypothetical protein
MGHPASEVSRFVIPHSCYSEPTVHPWRDGVHPEDPGRFPGPDLHLQELRPPAVPRPGQR